MNKRYLGDAVYAELNDARQIILTTEDGPDDLPTNTIYLEPEVYKALVEWVQKCAGSAFA